MAFGVFFLVCMWMSSVPYLRVFRARRVNDNVNQVVDGLCCVHGDQTDRNLIGVLGVANSLLESGASFSQFGTPQLINDGSVVAGDTTFGRPESASFVGLKWGAKSSRQVCGLTLILVIYSNGGWFGINNIGPKIGSALRKEHLVEPVVQVTFDTGKTWSEVPAHSNYVRQLENHIIHGRHMVGTRPPPVTFRLLQPLD